MTTAMIAAMMYQKLIWCSRLTCMVSSSCVAGERLRTVMSSIIRRRRGLIVAIWGSCPEEGRCDNPHPLRQDASAQLPRRPSRAAGSFNPHPGGRIVTSPRGFSVLEASRMAGIPHISVCGGRGRCSTCRVRVIEGLDAQPAPTPQEGAALARIKAGPDVRLACQFQPADDLTIVPILATGRKKV